MTNFDKFKYKNRIKHTKKERSLIRKKALTVTMFLLIFVFAFSMSVSAADFEDTDHWAKHSIEFVTDEGYFVGTSETEFSPDMPMTRGMFVTVLSRMSDIDESLYSHQVFTDVHPSDYYFSAVCWAYENGIVAGMSADEFQPQTLVTREQICRMLAQYVEHSGVAPCSLNESSRYADDASISLWAHDSVYLMQEYGYLIGGSDNTFRPVDNATRAECASVFARVCGKFFDNYVVETPEVGNGNAGNTENRTYLGEFTNTFYCPGYCCNGQWAGMTSTGAVPTPGVTIAVDPSVIPLGSKVYIEFENENAKVLSGVYIAQDVGGGVNGKHIDVLVENHTLAYYYGVGKIRVYLINE